MNKPTRSQKRGYLMLCILLTAILLAIIILPRRGEAPQPQDHSQLKEAIALYGDEMQQPTALQPAHHNSSYNHQGYNHHYEPARHQSFEQKERKNFSIELNSADTTQLMRLRGIGPVLASRIVKYRSRLGGFVRIEQLREVYGLPTETYEQIATLLTLDTTSVVRIDINHATLNDLKGHPYLDYYQARAICDYRSKVGSIKNYQDMLTINLLDDKTVKKLHGYIQFNQQ